MAGSYVASHGLLWLVSGVFADFGTSETTHCVHIRHAVEGPIGAMWRLSHGSGESRDDIAGLSGLLRVQDDLLELKLQALELVQLFVGVMSALRRDDDTLAQPNLFQLLA